MVQKKKKDLMEKDSFLPFISWNSPSDATFCQTHTFASLPSCDRAEMATSQKDWSLGHLCE